MYVCNLFHFLMAAAAPLETDHCELSVYTFALRDISLTNFDRHHSLHVSMMTHSNIITFFYYRVRDWSVTQASVYALWFFFLNTTMRASF